MSAKIWHCARLIRSLASPKILTLGNAQINLALRSTYSIVGCAQDTLARQNQNKFCFCARLIRIFALNQKLGL